MKGECHVPRCLRGKRNRIQGREAMLLRIQRDLEVVVHRFPGRKKRRSGEHKGQECTDHQELSLHKRPYFKFPFHVVLDTAGDFAYSEGAFFVVWAVTSEGRNLLMPVKRYFLPVIAISLFVCAALLPQSAFGQWAASGDAYGRWGRDDGTSVDVPMFLGFDAGYLYGDTTYHISYYIGTSGIESELEFPLQAPLTGVTFGFGRSSMRSEEHTSE